MIPEITPEEWARQRRLVEAELAKHLAAINNKLVENFERGLRLFMGQGTPKERHRDFVNSPGYPMQGISIPLPDVKTQWGTFAGCRTTEVCLN